MVRNYNYSYLSASEHRHLYAISFVDDLHLLGG